MTKCNRPILMLAIIALSMGSGACSKSDESGTNRKPVTKSLPDKDIEELRKTFHAYMQACVEKDIDAITDVYDLEHIAAKWEEKVGNDPNEIREMIKGIVANKPDEFYRICARAQVESDKVIEKEMPKSVGKARIVEVKYGDWSWTFRQRPTGWKLIEEGVSGPTFGRISEAQGQ